MVSSASTPPPTARAAASAHVALNRACNLRCGFCPVQAADVEPVAVRAARALRAVRMAAAAGQRALVFGGGEPVLEPYLPALIRAAVDLGITDIALETNATRIGVAQAQVLRSAGLTRAVVACNALDPAVADAMSEVAGAFAKMAAGVRAFLDAGVAVDLTVALLPANTGALAGVVRRARVVFPDGLARVQAVIARPIAVAHDKGPVLDVPQIAAELQAACVAAAESGVTLRPAPGTELAPCAFADPLAARPVLRLGRELVLREAARYQRLPACAACVAQFVCPGVQPALAAAMATVGQPVPAALAEEAAPVVRRDGDPSAVWRSIGLHPEHQPEPDSVRQLGLPRRPLPPVPIASALGQLHAAGPTIDREALELRAALRDLLRRELPTPDDAAAVQASLERQGLRTRRVASRSLGVTGAARVFVFAARDGAVLDVAERLDAAMEAAPAPRAEAMRQLGILLGYPACCVEAFVRAPDQDDAANVARLAAASAHANVQKCEGSATSQPLAPEQNWAVVPLRPFSYLPCQPDCPATLSLARKSLAAVAEVRPDHAAAVRRLLSGIVLAWSFERFALLPGARGAGPDAVAYDEVVGYADLEPGSAVAGRPSLRAFELEFLARLRRGDRLQREGDRLHIWRQGKAVDAVRFAGQLPPLLDFTGRAD